MTLFGIDWETYEEISEELGESRSLHLTFDKGVLTIMPLTELHELLKSFLNNFITLTGLVLRINVIATGSATLRSKRRQYGVEPDLSYFVSRADIHQIKNHVPPEVELAPDIVCEIDVYHLSEEKFKIYSDLGISEFWLYENEKLKIFRLQTGGEYKEIERSEELPILTGEILTDFLNRGQKEQQFKVLSDFQNWLQEQNK